MGKSCLTAVAACALALSGAVTTARAADTYTIDPAHSSVTFKIQHMGLAWIHGRFNEFSGTCTVDKDNPGKSSFAVTIKAESIDTANAKRDGHLRSPDFFNVKQFPTISFKGTAAKAVAGGYEVTGDFTLHGVTKPLTFTLTGGKTAEFPKGMQRIGFTTELKIKRSDFDMGKFTEMLSDEVVIEVSFEGVKK
jgi:polyisoprenoid-binding protein YceI